jgi:hypothetical protein
MCWRDDGEDEDLRRCAEWIVWEADAAGDLKTVADVLLLMNEWKVC